MGWWVAELLETDPAMLVSWVVWVIASITLHELAHGWMALRLGDDTPRTSGHMTWNPVVHMGIPSLVMFALVGIAWGAMPINPSRLRGRWADFKVSLAGPAMNIALAIASACAAALWSGYAQGIPDPLWTNFMTFFLAGTMLNVVLAIFNLLPIPPLDGSRMLAEVFPPYRRLISHPQALIFGLILMILLMGRLGSFVIAPATGFAYRAIDTLQSILPGARPFLGAFRAPTLEQLLADPKVREELERLEREGLPDEPSESPAADSPPASPAASEPVQSSPASPAPTPP